MLTLSGRAPQLTKLLSQLVQIPSVNPMGRTGVSPDVFYEHRLTDFLEKWLLAQGATPVRQPVALHRDNLVAVCEPSGPVTRTILWEVHQDTVPVEGMTVKPFGGELLNDRVFGRGACDVKGGMAVMLGAFERLMIERKASRFGQAQAEPGARVILALTVDEEHTFLGVQTLVGEKCALLRQMGGWPDIAIVAEPTNLRIVAAHKGVARWNLLTRGVPCHSSRPDQGHNAIYRMARVVSVLEHHAAQLMAMPGDAQLGTGTLSVGKIQGGISVNTVPDECVIEIDRRLAPGESPDSADNQLRRALSQGLGGWPSWLELPAAWMCCPGLVGPDQGAARNLLASALMRMGLPVHVDAVPYGTDASTIAEAGIPSVVFGPGDIKLAHTAAESIPVAELVQAEEVLIHLAKLP